jgi:hypothetical protein
MEWRDRAGAQWYDDDGLVVCNLQSTQGARDSGTLGMTGYNSPEFLRQVHARGQHAYGLVKYSPFRNR